jgi:serine-type D-Ala-D-Ala carboxypeptidase (penicillin-binding protein 5/6)
MRHALPVVILICFSAITWAAKPAQKTPPKAAKAEQAANAEGAKEFEEPLKPTNAASATVAARAYVLRDFQSNQILVSQSPDMKVEPASLTKLMTAYLAFKALAEKKLTEEQTLPISTKAWKAIGSRMFVEPNKPVTVGELLRGMIIQSGNDASVALAEAIGGSEEMFAELMNKEAARLGMKNSHFMNAPGLPDPQHYSTAEDMSLLAAAIIRDFPQFYSLYSTKEYTYNNIRQPNRNRLLWLDPSVDGMKTGHTDAAGYCLVASAKRGDRRLISVVLGAASESVRAVESQKLLNYGFLAFDTRRMYKKDDAIAPLEVYKGKQKTLKAGFDRDVFLTLKKEDFDRLKNTLVATQPLIAPISQGQQIGTVKLTLDDKPVAEYPVLALENVPIAGFFSRTWDSVRLMMK